MSKKKITGEDAASVKERHPTFDAMWEKHNRLVFWWGYKIAYYLNRQRRAKVFSGDDFFGYLTLRFNYCLHWYNEDLSEFTTYFSKNLFGSVVRWVVRADIEDLPMSLDGADESMRTKNSDERSA